MYGSEKSLPCIRIFRDPLANEEEADLLKSLEALLHIITNKMEMGMIDFDLDLSKNFRFVDNVPIKLDVGEFKIDPTQKNKKITKLVIDLLVVQLDNWLKKECPHLLNQMHEILENQ